MKTLETPQDVIRTSMALCDFPERQIYSLEWESWSECGSCTKHFLPSEADADAGGRNARLCREPQCWRTQTGHRFNRQVM